MATNAIDFTLEEEEFIDCDRIVDGHLVPNEYFCPICHNLLWKPVSCSSCQHVFCERCIRRWIENKQSNDNVCPFRCQEFQQHRCPPYLHSLLSHLRIHCQNSSFGCTEVLSYDQLEAHEKALCQYLTRTCRECEQLVLVSRFNEHREVAGLCVPCPVKCRICQDSFDVSIFRDHFHQCCQNRLNQLTQIRNLLQLTRMLRGGQQIAPNPVGTFFGDMATLMSLFEEQKRMSRLPTNLKGINKIRRAREEQCGHLKHIFLMLTFICMNWKKAPFFLYTLTFAGFFMIGTFLIGLYVSFFNWVYTHVRYGPLVAVFLNYLLCYGTSLSLETVPDSLIIVCLGVLAFLFGCTSQVTLEYFEMDALFKRPILSVVLSGLGILLVKFILLLVRLYYWSMPTYMAAGVIGLLNLYFGYKIYRICPTINASAATHQPLLPV